MRKKAQGSPPEGFRYQMDILLLHEEQDLVGHVRELPLKEYEFHGFTGKRRVIYYGWHYDSGEGRLKQTEPIPTFLHELRERAASFAGLAAEGLAHAQVIEYKPGVAIGWHRDREIFGDVIGISLVSACTFRFRHKAASSWERYSLTAAPRSIYLLRGSSRTDWQHSIPGVETLRYSIIFRSLR
jgi:alkylated DNA repair dioxygenase AlkB